MSQGEQQASEASLHLELQQAIETFRFQTGLLTQVCGFLVAVDSLLVGYGLTQNKSILLAIATSIPLLMIAALLRILKHALPISLVALRLERLLLGGQIGLATTYLQMQFSDFYSPLEAVLESGDVKDDGWLVVSINTSGRLLRSRTIFYFITIFLAQVDLFVISVAIFHIPLI